MPRLFGTTTQGRKMKISLWNNYFLILLVLLKIISLTSICLWLLINLAVDLVSLWRSNLTKAEEYQELLSELTCWKDHVFVRCLIQREIIIASTCFVLHHLRYGSP